MQSNAIFLIVFTTLLSCYSGGCRSTSPQNTKEEFDLTGENSTEAQLDEFEDEETADDGTQLPTSIAHPKEATAWSTRRLIMTSRQPSPKLIQQCLDNVESLARSATNLEALGDAAADMRRNVTNDVNLYHWCFYQMMASLDEQLERPLSLMDEKADLFLDKMSRLWILAEALDGASNSNIYLKYLKSRYTSISLQTFGRMLENVDSGLKAPVDNRRGKSAGYFFDE